MVSNFLHDVVVGVINFNPNIGSPQGVGHFAGVGLVLLSYGNDVALGWRKPGGEASAKVLDENADKAFH